MKGVGHEAITSRLFTLSFFHMSYFFNILLTSFQNSISYRVMLVCTCALLCWKSPNERGCKFVYIVHYLASLNNLKSCFWLILHNCIWATSTNFVERGFFTLVVARSPKIKLKNNSARLEWSRSVLRMLLGMSLFTWARSSGRGGGVLGDCRLPKRERALH